jgi:hypothetical protein
MNQVKEETSLRSRAGSVIARPTHGIDVFVGDADELIGEMIFKPVRQHIRQTPANGDA